MKKEYEKLLGGIENLKKPNWHEMDNTARLLHACLCAYVKHSMIYPNSDEIGWDELNDILHI